MGSVRPPGPKPEDETLVERADRAVDEARQWNRDLRKSVSDAKAHAKAMAEARARRLSDRSS